jgi:CDP-glycerol glycerophosphotransferase (TagB/SpsB family)
MLKTTDLILLLTELEEKGVEGSSQQIRELVNKGEILFETLKFINDNRLLDVANFYEQIRKSYNSKKSSLYINLVREEVKNPKDMLTTLASLNLQILLFANHIENPQMFLSHSRAEEITRVLNNYYRTYDLKPVVALRSLIKADLKSFESIKK